MNMENMKAAFADEAFVKDLFKLETAEEVQAALKEKSVELTEEELLTICSFFTKAKGGELSDEMLEQVAGGGFWSSLWEFLCSTLGMIGQGAC